MIQFIDRKQELKFLDRKYKEKKKQLIIIYGRRRVGKTELIKEFLKDKKGIYLLCSRDSIRENLNQFKVKIAEFTGKDYFLKLDINSFYDLFKYLGDEIKDKKVIISIDEFPYLIEINRGITSTFQSICDELLSENIMLILCGSSIGMMETEVLDYKSPLYGRRTGEWKLKPLNFRFMREYFSNYDIEEVVKLWCILGGTPFYWHCFDKTLSVNENIKQRILTKGEILYNEPKILLREEFREPRIYMLILKYLSLDYNTLSEISSITGLDKGNLSKYLFTLEETGIIRSILPIGKRKRGIYVITEPLFNFWFRFVYPNNSDLEIDMVKEVFTRIKHEINSYYGRMFEFLVEDLLKKKVLDAGSFTKIGRWWHKDKEIDLVALNSDSKEIAFFEVKWSELNAMTSRKILKDLEEKSRFVNWNNEERKEYFGIIAKKIKGKKKLREEGYLLFDLDDFEKEFRRGKG